MKNEDVVLHKGAGRVNRVEGGEARSMKDEGGRDGKPNREDGRG